MMVGGDENSYKNVKEFLNSFSKFTKYMGKSGSGQLTKMVNQICIGGLVQALAEGINFSERAGLNTSDVMEVITKGAAQSRLCGTFSNNFHNIRCIKTSPL